MALPLAVRKDIRDNEPKIQEANKKINAALGFDVTIEVNNESLQTLLTEANHSKKDSFTGPVSQYLDSLAQQIAVIAKDLMVKEELARVMPAKKVVFVLRKEDLPADEPGRSNFGGSSYTGFEFKDGALNVVVPVKNFWSNIGDVADPKTVSLLKVLSRTTTLASTLPLHIRVALRDTEAKRNDAVKKISAALGLDMIFDFDALAVYAGLSEHKDKDRMPEAIVRYLDGLNENLTKTCKDDMVKEALLEVVKSKKLKFAVVKGAFADNKKYGGDNYIGLSFENGDLTVVIPSDNFWCNLDNIKTLKIEKML